MNVRDIPRGASLAWGTLLFWCAWLPATAQSTTTSAPASSRIHYFSQALVGTWESATDSSFTRRFDADGKAVDHYRDDPSATSNDTWTLVDRAHPDPALDSTEAGVTYLRLESAQEVVFYKIVKLDKRRLQIRYTDRGGLLMKFVRIK